MAWTEVIWAGGQRNATYPAFSNPSNVIGPPGSTYASITDTGSIYLTDYDIESAFPYAPLSIDAVELHVYWRGSGGSYSEVTAAGQSGPLTSRSTIEPPDVITLTGISWEQLISPSFEVRFSVSPFYGTGALAAIGVRVQHTSGATIDAVGLGAAAVATTSTPAADRYRTAAGQADAIASTSAPDAEVQVYSGGVAAASASASASATVLGVTAERWTVELLDMHGNARGVELQLRGGSLEWSTFRAVGGTGSIDITLDPRHPISWLTDRIRISHHAGSTLRPCGVWLIAAPERSHTGPITHVTLQLADKTDLLNTPIGAWHTVAGGETVTNTVADIIRSRAGETPALPPHNGVTPRAYTWAPEDTWLRVVNDLLGLINYGSLWADMGGQLRSEPYLPPADRRVVAVYGFDDGQELMRVEWDDSLPLWDIPTGFAVFTEGDEDTEGMSAVAHLPDEHPLSALSRGREILRVETAEASNQAALNGIAQRRLNSQLSVVYRASIKHPMDDTVLGDAVIHSPAGFRGTIVNRAIDLGVGAVVEDSVRHIWTDLEEVPWLSSTA